jgi:hypothetical protein
MTACVAFYERSSNLLMRIVLKIKVAQDYFFQIIMQLKVIYCSIFVFGYCKGWRGKNKSTISHSHLSLES